MNQRYYQNHRIMKLERSNRLEGINRFPMIGLFFATIALAAVAKAESISSLEREGRVVSRISRFGSWTDRRCKGTRIS